MAGTNVFYRYLQKKYPLMERGEGLFVWDSSGKRYLDGSSAVLVANIGYGVAAVAEALKEQALQTGFSHGAIFTSKPQEELARLITEPAPPGLDYAYLVSGGTEANETALSLAIQYHRQRGNMTKWKMIGRRFSYHGSSFATMSVAGNVQRRRLYSPLIMPFPLVPAAHCYRCYCGSTYPECDLACARELENTILAEGPENIAAFILEPIIGTSAAASVPPPGYLPLVREICDRHDVLLIADEVMCGYGRSGRYLACDHWNVSPDMFTLGKGLGGGYTPVAAVVVRDTIYETFKNQWGKFIHGYTYQGNPVSCAAGVAVNRFIRDNDLFAQVPLQGAKLKKGLENLAANREYIGDVRGLGLLLGLELVRDRSTKESFPAALQAAERVRAKAMEEGLMLYTGVGTTADIEPRDCLIVAPPFIIGDAEIDLLIEILGRALDLTEPELS